MTNHHLQLWLTTTFSYDQSPPAKCNHHVQLFLITTFARSNHHLQLNMSTTSFLLYLCSLGAIWVLSECSLNALWVLLKWIWGKKMKIESFCFIFTFLISCHTKTKKTIITNHCPVSACGPGPQLLLVSVVSIIVTLHLRAFPLATVRHQVPDL